MAATLETKSNIQSPQSPTITDAFTRMKNDFDQCMVLVYRNEKLVPAYWDTTWVLANNAPPPIDLTGASIFRIVLDTKSPYHGYVAPCPVNDSFFAAWNQRRYPDHVTMVPMIQNNEIVGMVLGLTSRAKGAMVNLNQYQSLGIELAIRLAA
jgi:hypothetical protein